MAEAVSAWEIQERKLFANSRLAAMCEAMATHEVEPLHFEASYRPTTPQLIPISKIRFMRYHDPEYDELGGHFFGIDICAVGAGNNEGADRLEPTTAYVGDNAGRLSIEFFDIALPGINEEHTLVWAEEGLSVLASLIENGQLEEITA